MTNLEGGDEDKTTLAQKDIRFARTIQRLQRSLVSELEKMAIVHLYTLGFRGQDLLSFKISLNNPSRLAELQQLEYMKTKFETSTSVPEGVYSKRWVASNILGMTDSEFLRNQRETYYDRKYQQALEGLAEQEAIEAEGGGMGDLGGDGLGDDLGGELGDLGGEEDAGLEGGDESALLATPGRREDNPKTRHEGAPHKPVASDLRSRGNSGPRRRKIRKEALPVELNTRRKNTGSSIGNPLGDMPDVRFGLEEQKASIYSRSETTLFENTSKVRKLLAELDNHEAKKDEAQ